MASARAPAALALVGTGLALLAYSWDVLRGEPLVEIGPRSALVAAAGLACAAASMLLAARRQAGGALGAAAVALGSTTLLLGAGEAALRLRGYGHREARFGRSLELVHRPYEVGQEAGREYRLNGIALRDDDFPLEPLPGELRVLCLGDSSTFGFGVEMSEAYPQVLEGRLRARMPGRAVQVVNGGYVSATSFQGILQLERLAPLVRPGWVVCAFGHNDRWLRPLPDARGGTGKAAALVAQSRVVILLSSALARFLPPRQDRFVPRVSPAEHESNLEALVASIRARGARPLLMSLPDDPDVEGAAPLAEALLAAGKEGEAARFLRECTRMTRLNPYPEAFDMLAELEERAGRGSEAARLRSEAERRRRLAPRLRDQTPYREALERVAARTGTAAVVVTPEEARGRLLDVCHPSAELHREIAARLAAAIEEMSEGREGEPSRSAATRERAPRLAPLETR